MVGSVDVTSLIILLTGIGLLILEVLIPGFGLPGISGIILVILGIFMITESTAMSLGLALGITFLVILLSLYIIKKVMKKNKLKNIILDTSLSKEKEYLSTDSMDKYNNKTGITLTQLRPSGFIEIEGKKLDALSDDGFIAKGIEVKVLKVEGAKIFVRRV